MNLLSPVPIDLLATIASDMPEDDTYSAWSSGTTYAVGDVVYLANTRRRYACVAAHSGINPTSDTTATYWSDFGAATRWRPFDGTVSRGASKPLSLYYEVTIPEACDSLALFRLSGTTVRVRINAVGYDVTTAIETTPAITDMKDFFFYKPSVENELVVTGLTLAAGGTIRIDVTATNGIAGIGEIVLGNTVNLGRTIAGTSLGLQSFSTVTRNVFGEADVVERPYIDEATYEFTVARQDEQRVKRLIGGRLARPAVFFSDVTHGDRGTTVYGFPTDFSLPISGQEFSFASLTVEGVI